MKIEDIQSPTFLKDLSFDELNQLCNDIRTFIIEHLSKTGGHLSANLGVVELIVAMHYVFDSPHDKIIFDVGHQSYTHKILTGRAKDFDCLRQKYGLSGYCNYEESPHDAWEAGHSSTALSAAAGFLEAKDGGADIGEVIAFVGDGSLQNGLSFEGINYLGTHHDQKAIIIINDNDMSISKNVGRLAKSMSRIRIRPSYARAKRITPRFIQRLFRKAKDTLKAFIYGNNLFSALGYKYYGPIDGHSLKELVSYLEFAKKSHQSVVLHVKTIKGKGYPYAENDENGSWHGVGTFDIHTGVSHQSSKNEEVTWSKGMSELLVPLVKENPYVRIISPAMMSGACLEDIAKAYPNQVIDVGIAEEHAIVMAASLSRFGFIPIVSIYSTFLQRAYDQLNHDVCRSNHHVIFLIDRAGLVGGDGSTHQGIFDVAYLSHLPNMVIIAPKDLGEAKSALEFAMNYLGPVAIRYPKATISSVVEPYEALELGKWSVIYPISEVNIITYGPDINQYARKLAGRGVGLINARFIKPLDEALIKALNHKRILIVEEVVQYGSLGVMIEDAQKRLGLTIDIECYHLGDQYIDSGTSQEIKNEMRIDVDSILQKI
ncbi:MAG: 1-deoxy-D-xylulose-5-phosphate synthase [Bacilli bacterium]|nr:1-deoxy-D-xylulose-5-phosphate synthase [Bacilli bacterium]